MPAEAKFSPSTSYSKRTHCISAAQPVRIEDAAGEEQALFGREQHDALGVCQVDDRLFGPLAAHEHDAEHIHHKLLKAGFSQKRTVAIMTSVAIIAGAIASLCVSKITIIHYLIYIVILIVLMLVLSLFDIFTKNVK